MLSEIINCLSVEPMSMSDLEKHVSSERQMLQQHMDMLVHHGWVYERFQNVSKHK